MTDRSMPEPSGALPGHREVGRSVRPLEWEARTSGAVVYAHDVALPGMLVGRILRSPHPHARIRSIETVAPSSMPGVRAVVSAADLPRGRTYLHQGGALSDRTAFAEGVVRFVGQEVAAVAAEDEESAAAALAAMRVRYRVLRAPLTIDEALAHRAPELHQRPAGGNVSVQSVASWGEIEAEFRDAAHVATGTYRYPQIAHASMEPHTTIAWWREECLELWTSTQSPYYIRKEVAHMLGLRAEQVKIHPVAVGGGFGAKSKITEHEVIAALLSMRSGLPVKIALSREEEFSTTKSRHEFRTAVRVALDADGRLAAFDADLLVDNGAFNHSGPPVMHAGMGVFGLLYRPRAVRVRGRLIDTAKVPGGQFRGYGMPQTSLALESEIDELARTSGIDPIELRIRNANLPGQETVNGARVGSAGLVECLRAAREAIGWDEKRRNPRPGRGLGVAAAVHGSGTYSWPGSNESSARIEIDGEGRVTVVFGGADPGTGQRTLLAQIVAEELGVAAEDVTVRMMDLSMDRPDQGSWSSRGTHFGGHAAQTAARAAADLLLDAAREKFATSDVTLEDGHARTDADAIPLGDLVSYMTAGTGGVLACDAVFEDSSVIPTSSLAERGGRGNTSPTYAFAAHIAEVDVDIRTGEVKVVDYVAAHDAGAVLNPAQAESQVVGGVVMGLGAALREELLFDHGRMVNPAYLHYGAPRAPDAPVVRVLFVGEPDASGPYGAKSVGEISMVPVGAAVANAVRDATGLRIRELPITPDKIVSAAQALEMVPKLAPAPVRWRPGRWWIATMRWAYPRGVAWLLHRFGRRFARRRHVGPVSAVARPESLEELHTLAGAGHTPVGATTELQLLRRQRLSVSTRLVSVGSVGELTRVAHDDGSLEIGGAVTLRALADELVGRVPVVAEAVETIATPQIRAVATVAGNLLQEKRCWFFRNDFECYKRSGPASPCYAILGDHRFYHASMEAHRCQAVTPSDLATVLVALDATAELSRHAGRRTVPVAELYTGPGETCLTEDEVLSRVRVPASSTRKTAVFEKLRLWSGDFAVTSVALAANVEAGVWGDVSLCVGALAPVPWRATRTPEMLEGRRVSGADVERALSAELSRLAHPLPGNGWKLDVAVALAGRAAARMNQERAVESPAER